MKLENAGGKIKEVIAKIGQRNLIIIGAVFVIGIAVALNFILFNGGNVSDADGMNLAVDIAELNNIEDGADGETSYTALDNAVQSPDSYFTATTVSRQRARDNSIEILEAVVTNAGTLDEVKDKALGDISQIALDVSREVNVETLILSKGFEQCVAVINGDLANIIVSSDGLLPNEIAQINEIVYEQTGIIPSNVKIIEHSAPQS
jgi:hypothetical protein